MNTVLPTRRPSGSTASSGVVTGLGLTLASAVMLSVLGLLTQLAYARGASVGTLLSGRFVVATATLWTVLLVTGRGLPTHRQAAAGLALGVGFSAHAWLFSASLARIDAGLVDLLLFSYPALVTLGAVALRHDHWNLRRAVALGSATAGSALVLVGGLGSVDPLGATLALCSAVAYAGYILSSAGQVERTGPLPLTALVNTGAAVTLSVSGVAQRDVSFDIGVSALALVALVGLVAVAGMFAFVSGVAMLGPSRASIVSAVQPALTPVLGFAVFSDRLTAAQVSGGALVVTGVVVLEARVRSAGTGSRFKLRRHERRAVARLGAVKTVPSGTRVIHQGGLANAFFVIVNGNAAVIQDERHIARLGPGEFFGEIGLLEGGRRTASVEASTSLTLLVLPRRDFAWAMRRVPALASQIREAARQRLMPPTQARPGGLSVAKA